MNDDADQPAAGTRDVLREQDKRRIGEFCAAVAFPLLAIGLLFTLINGVVAGTLEVPLRHYPAVIDWAGHPVGFILVACVYVVGIALFCALSFIVWQARRGRF